MGLLILVGEGLSPRGDSTTERECQQARHPPLTLQNGEGMPGMFSFCKV